MSGTYDIITVGGGLGGSTLAKVMAEPQPLESSNMELHCIVTRLWADQRNPISGQALFPVSHDSDPVLFQLAVERRVM